MALSHINMIAQSHEISYKLIVLLHPCQSTYSHHMQSSFWNIFLEIFMLCSLRPIWYENQIGIKSMVIPCYKIQLLYSYSKDEYCEA